MYNSTVRFILIAFCLVAAGVSIYYLHYQFMALFLFLFLFVIWNHFRRSSVLMASKYFKNKEYEKAKVLLAEVKNPDYLSKSRRGYYEFMQGNIALHEQRWDNAEYHFQIASRFSVGGKNEKAYVVIHLANLAIRKKDKERATAYTNLAKELATTERSKDIIVKLEKEIKKI